MLSRMVKEEVISVCAMLNEVFAEDREAGGWQSPHVKQTHSTFLFFFQ